MPTDYSKSVIYKITCNDPSITKMYFGSTANIADRRRKHKHNYSNKSEQNIRLLSMILVEKMGAGKTGLLKL